VTLSSCKAAWTWTGRGVFLPEANDVGSLLTGTAFGTGSDFVFNNVSPLKLQQISISVSGKRRVNAGFFQALPELEFDPELQNQLLAGLDRSTDFSMFDKDKEKDDDKKSNEKEISKGLNAQCP
jgi:hypothetical protein